MTQDDDILDFRVVVQPDLNLYRLARARYANLSGVGASAYPGRWNVKGREAIYTSTEQSLPLLERLVHTPKTLIPANLAMLKINFAGDWSRFQSHDNLFRDPNTGGCFAFYPTLPSARRAFEQSSEWKIQGYIPFAVAVPSVIVAVWNVVLFPEVHGFWDHVALERVKPFPVLDPRLFPVNTPVEDPETTS